MSSLSAMQALVNVNVNFSYMELNEECIRFQLARKPEDTQYRLRTMSTQV